MSVERIRWRLRDHDRALADLAGRQEELRDHIRHARARLADATRTLDEYDRPLHRRHHRTEIENAKREARLLPGQIDDIETELSELPKEIEAARFARERTVCLDEAVQRGDPERVEQAIQGDARTRGMEAVDQPMSLIVAHLGPVPDDPTSRERWVTAAGRIAQHRTLWPVADDVLVGRPPVDGPPERSVTYYAATKTIADLDRTMGVDRRSIDRPGPGLSL